MPRAVALLERLVVEQPERQLARALEILFAMLVMDRKRLGGVLLQGREHRGPPSLQGQDGAPRLGGLRELPVAPETDAAPVERFSRDVDVRAAIGGRACVARDRAIDRSG